MDHVFSSLEKQRIKDIHEYELGKRHLANMMSLDPVTMTQQDVEASYSYSSRKTKLKKIYYIIPII